jgi:hypothetical protein
MAKRPSKSQPRKKKKKAGYTAGEWFMVILGLALVIMVLGIVVTSVLGG